MTIVDCHTHIAVPEHAEARFADDLSRTWGGDVVWDAFTPQAHWAAVGSKVDRAVVLAVDAPASGFVVPDDYVAGYVAQHPERLIGFCSVDPNRPDAVERLRWAVTGLGLRGLKLAPIYQHVDPRSPRAMALFKEAERLGIPVLIHQGTTFLRDAPMAHARPWLLDEVAQACPGLRLCIAHLGHPWCAETMAVIRKHPHLYSDVSAVHGRPLQLYLALVAACEYRVADRLLFGSDHPFGTPDGTIAALRGMGDLVRGTGLPAVPADVIEGIIARDALAALGLT